MKIGVVIVHYGSWAKTDTCRKSFTKQVDNVFVYNADEKNIGYGAACNYGFDVLTSSEKYDRIVFVNNDTIASSDMIERMASVDADFVCPKVVNLLGNIIYCGGSIERGGPLHFTEFYSTHTDLLYGCCIMVKPYAFKRCRFNEKYFMYFEDVELSLAAKYFGFTTTVCKEAILFHDKQKENSYRTRYYATRNFPRAMGWSLFYFEYVVKRFIYFVLTGQWGAAGGTIKGFCHALIGRTGEDSISKTRNNNSGGIS